MPSEDIVKLKEVYKGFENYVIKYLLKNLEKVIENESGKSYIKDLDPKDSCWSFIITSITLLCSSLMSGKLKFYCRSTIGKMLVKMQVFLIETQYS